LALCIMYALLAPAENVYVSALVRYWSVNREFITRQIVLTRGLNLRFILWHTTEL